MKSPPRAMLFDFDGTLADSFGAITLSTNHVRSHFGLSELSESEVRGSVGFGLRHLMQQLIPNTDPDESVAVYREHHPGVMAAGTVLIPGVLETLNELKRRNIRTAICSNKNVQFTKKLTKEKGLSDLIDEVLGPEDVGVPKPDPAMLIEAMKRLEATSSNTIYVGDMTIDIEVSRAAKVPVWIMLGGANSKETIEAQQPDRILHHFAEILNGI